MVHAAQQRPAAASIAGGFVLVSVPGLMACWRACRSAPLGIGDFRAWLAAHEMVARRSRPSHGRAAHGPAIYSAAELARLTGVAPRRARGSIRRLAAAGLIEWSEGSIRFPEPPDPPPTPDGLSDTIGGGRGSLAIPRRILRSLVDGGGVALIATALAALLRCLSRRRPGWHGRGRFKASWAAAVFGVSRRRVKSARLELIQLGWIDPEPTAGPRAENRWGRAYRIDLAWAAPSPPDGPTVGAPKSPPTPADRRAEVTPSVNQEPLRDRDQDQEPGRGPSGIYPGGSGGTLEPTATPTDPAPARPESVSRPPAATAPAPGPAAPTLRDVRVEDLKDTGRLLELHRQAMGRGLVGSSEADRLKFVGAAEHALAIGRGNPPGLFAYLIRGACWRYITQGDEDRANGRIKAYLRGPDRPSVGPSPVRPALSGEARTVLELRRALACAGFRGDPFPQVRRHDPSWTRERWDRALAELDQDRRLSTSPALPGAGSTPTTRRDAIR